MSVLLTIAIAWLAIVAFAHLVVLPLLRRGPGDQVTSLMWYVIRLHCRLVHRARSSGVEKLRKQREPGPLIVVSNHTGTIDPFLLQAACRFEIRWMMAENFMFPTLDWLWKRQRIIPVARDGSDSGPAREAIRHVRGGGAIGVFPEGRIVTPHGRIWPFFTGAGLIVARTRAPVLLVWISDTPPTHSVVGSLLTPSRARVRFIDLIQFDAADGAETITRRLRERLHEASGWVLDDDPPPLRRDPAWRAP